ncbi:hypothetical protein [Dactylosporangium sp. NPDC051541]|uniref:hypothetical protein n=1 Tax=Dactylosporangium sp. NPDC051541 TaxID=3363977 RepID=UPI0037A15728
MGGELGSWQPARPHAVAQRREDVVQCQRFRAVLDTVADQADELTGEDGVPLTGFRDLGRIRGGRDQQRRRPPGEAGDEVVGTDLPELGPLGVTGVDDDDHPFGGAGRDHPGDLAERHGAALDPVHVGAAQPEMEGPPVGAEQPVAGEVDQQDARAGLAQRPLDLVEHVARPVGIQQHVAPIRRQAPVERIRQLLLRTTVNAQPPPTRKALRSSSGRASESRRSTPASIDISERYSEVSSGRFGQSADRVPA